MNMDFFKNSSNQMLSRQPSLLYIVVAQLGYI